MEAVTGPVCILAGAGTGKTTTITRRIANQVLTGTFDARRILAVTFTRKAAQEMGSRLAELGVEGVPARTFHAAAARQLRHFTREHSEVLRSKFRLLIPIVRGLPKPYDRRAVSDLGAEIEWAKNGRRPPDEYAAAVEKAGREPPLPTGLMEGVYREYERRKDAAGLIDHEDQLELTIRLFQDDAAALAEFREGYRAFTVDEYQDVNLLQQTLLDLWLGEREELCAVGDDYQSIFGFTGATPRHQLGMPGRYPNATVVVLEDNYRSTPEVIATANRLVPELGGRKKVLRPTVAGGPEPEVRSFQNNEVEAAFIAKQIGRLHDAGVARRETAVLFRVNYRSSDYEAALLAAGIPFPVRGGGLLERAAARQVVPRLESRGFETGVPAVVREEARRSGYLVEPPDDLGAAELSFQADLAQIVALGRGFDGESRTVAEFVADLRDRLEAESERDAVQLMTYHSAKGLEFEAVFLPLLEDGEMPFWRAVKTGGLEEERRLLYVGLTRAKRHLFVTRSSEDNPPSPFLEELRSARPAARTSKSATRKSGREQPVIARVGLTIEWGGRTGRIATVSEGGAYMRAGSGARVRVPFGSRVSAGKRSGPLERPRKRAR